jgi:hypothetical protein
MLEHGIDFQGGQLQGQYSTKNRFDRPKVVGMTQLKALRSLPVTKEQVQTIKLCEKARYA